MSAKRAACILLTAIAFLQPVSADGEKTGPRPKVALVLSGGGALGFVHIGAVKVIEELGIPVDCVVGTSMGSIIGCFFALGYTGSEMEAIVRSIDWENIFIDSVPRSSSSYREKKASRPYPVSIGFDAKGFAISSGLSAGQRIMDRLSRYTLAYSEEIDFSSLPREYRAVATDVATGEEVVFSRGSLVDAMRASMAVPGVFTPHEVEGRYLMDGGIVRNLPVSVAKNLGADIVIAVDLGKMTVDPAEVDNPGSSLDRMLSIFINQNRGPERKLADVLIEPDTEGFSSGSFGSSQELIARGEAAARAARPALDEIAARIRKDRPGGAAPIVRKEPAAVRIDRIETRGASREGVAKIEKAFASHSGRLARPEEIRETIMNLFATGDWESLRFVFVPSGTGGRVLRITAKEKRKPTVITRIGVEFAGHMGIGADASWNDMEADHRSLSLNLTARDAFPGGSFWSTDFVIAEPGEVSTELTIPVFGGLFFAQGLSAASGKRPIYDDQKLVDEFRVRKFAARARAGTFLGEWGELSAGYELKRIESLPRFYEAGAETGGFTGVLGSAFLSLDVDTLSSVPFPESGALVSASYTRAEDWLGSSRYINKLEADARIYLSPAERHTFGIHSAAGTAFDGNLDFWNRFFIGGRTSLIGYYEYSLVGDHYCLLDLEYRYKVPGLGLPFKDIVYLRLRGSAGNVWQGDFPEGNGLREGWKFGGGLGMGVDTFFGAFNADMAVSDRGSFIVYFSLSMKL